MKTGKITHTPAFKIIGLILLFLLVNYFSQHLTWRLDLTQDQRYTLSEAALDAADNLNGPVYVDVFLHGDLPSEFRRLEAETRQILVEFKRHYPEIQFSFIDPAEEGEGTAEQLQAIGLQPTAITIQEDSKVSQEYVFPWALINYGEQTVRVPLLKATIEATTEERIQNSVQQLEYAFADAFTKLSYERKRKVAVIKGNGELEDIQIADFLNTLKEYYLLAPFTLDSANASPQSTLEALSDFDLALIAKPTEAFTDHEKLVLDQFIMSGGRSMWLIDKVAMEMDSLYRNQGRSIALPMDLNLDDMFFKYGVRIEPGLVSDLYQTMIVLATGSGNQTQYNPAPWVYHPLVFSSDNHPINTSVDAVRMRFASPIDTLSNGISKKILLASSELSKVTGTPAEISLDIISEAPDRETFNNGNQPLAVLLEGNFTSAFQNRVLPFKPAAFEEKGRETAMIVISDGDLIKNDLQNGRPMELGYDKWTNNFFGNKEFLLNSVNYLLDDNGLINIRNKEIDLSFLDTQKTAAEKWRWQLVNIGLPVIIMLVFGGVYNFLRRRKYGK